MEKYFIFWSKIPIFPNVSHMIFGLHMFRGVKFRKFLKFNLKIESKNIRIFQIVDLTPKTDKNIPIHFSKTSKMNLLTQYIHMVGLEFLIEWIFDENSLFHLKNTICSNFFRVSIFLHGKRILILSNVSRLCFNLNITSGWWKNITVEHFREYSWMKIS